MIFGLQLPKHGQNGFEWSYKGQRSKAFFRFWPVFVNHFRFAIYHGLGYGMSDCNRLLHKIDCFPFQPYDFTSAKSIIAAEQNGKFKRIAMEYLE